MLEVENLKKVFHNAEAVNDISFKVKPGQVFGLLGPNGAGKTTALRMIMNILKPDEGEIFYNDIPRAKCAQNLFGYLPEERGLYQRAFVLNLLVYFGSLNNLTRHKAQVEAIRYLDRLGLADYTKARINELSKGMQQKIQFIAASLHNPEVLILDEPFSGLDPVNQIVLRDIIQQYKSENKIVILSTHQMEQVEQICDDICLINQGIVIRQGLLSQIKKEFRDNAYLIEFDGDFSFIDDFNFIEIIEEKKNGIVVRVNNPAKNLTSLATYVFSQKGISSFSVVEPTLHDIFIKLIRKEGGKKS